MYSTQDVVNNQQTMSDNNYGMQNYEQSNYFVPTYNQNATEMTTSQPNQYAFQESPQKTLPESQMQQPEMAQQQTYDYSWNQPAPNITLANAMSSKPGFNSQNSTDDANSQQIKEKSNNVADEKKMSADQSKKVSQKDGKGGENAKSGWFGGIFSKLSLKAPNQMILPDDKNPTIVWDDKNKKWVNKDGGDNEDESFKPPPKMNEIMGKPMSPATFQQPQSSPIHQQQQQQPQQQQQIASPLNEMPVSANTIQSAAPVPTMPSGPPSQNMFKMQKRTLKKSYVDILGNSGNTTSAKPAPAPMIPTMETNFFNPQQSQGMPQFYNPNDFQ
jgi:hypothetical protein